MAKKKRRRYKRNKKARRINYGVNDRHHLCWTRRSWGKGYTRSLRLHPYCVISLPRDTLHHYIHTKLRFIPVPKQSSAKFALAHLDLLEKIGAIHDTDSIEKRLKILAALFDCTDQPTADAFREQLRIVCKFKKSPLD